MASFNPPPPRWIVIIFGIGVNNLYLVVLLPLPMVVAMALAVGKVVMATTPRTTGASAPTITMMVFALKMVIPVLFKWKSRRAPALSIRRGNLHNPWIVVTVAAVAPTAFRMPMLRRWRRQVPAMIRWRHSLHVLHSLDVLHSLPILRRNILALQYDVVQLAGFECLSPEPLVVVLQLKCIQMLTVPVLVVVETQLSISFPPVPFLDLVLASSTAIVWNHSPIIR